MTDFRTYRLAIRSSYVGGFVSFIAQNDIEFHHLTIAHRAYSLFRIVFYDGRLMYEYIFFCVISVDKTVATLHIEPLNGSSDFFG